MDEIERNARLLCRALWHSASNRAEDSEAWLQSQVDRWWQDYTGLAHDLAAVDLTLAPIDTEPADGCACQGCGRKYRVDVIVPDVLWERIKPAGKPPGAGLLCGACIGARVEATSNFDAFALAPIEPDEAMIAEMAKALLQAENDWATLVRETSPFEVDDMRVSMARAAWRAGIGREEG